MYYAFTKAPLAVRLLSVTNGNATITIYDANNTQLYYDDLKIAGSKGGVVGK